MIASSIDLESQLIAEEIENILESYPEELTQEHLAISELRIRLTTYVLTRLEQAKITRDKQEGCLNSLKRKLPYRSLELRLAVEQYIIEGIRNVTGVNLKPPAKNSFLEKSFVVLSALS
jgi:hypothetical protein